MVLAPVHAGQSDENGHGDRGDEEQPSPPAAGVADDQDRHGDVETAGGGLVPGRVGGGGQVLVELGDVRPGPFDHGSGREERAQFPEHDRGHEDDRPPVPGDGEEHDAGREGDDEVAPGAPGGGEDGIARVAPSVVKIRLQWVQPAVRWAANQRGIVWSPSTLPLPSLVISSPIPTITPRISTQATTTAAAMRPQWRTEWRPERRRALGSGRAGLRSARASG